MTLQLSACKLAQTHTDTDTDTHTITHAKATRQLSSMQASAFSSTSLLTQTSITGGLLSSLLVVEICHRLPNFNVFFIMLIMSSSTLSLKSPIQERACHEAKHLIPAQALRVVVREKVRCPQLAAKLAHKDSANTSAYQLAWVVSW